MSAPYTMQALQELADDGVHLLEIDDAGIVATVQELDALRARVAELERVQDAAFRDAHRAEADAARLREALEDIARVAYRGSAAASLARAALASAPNAEPTPRDMRVAEAVRSETSDMVRDADDGVPLDCLADSIETLNLAAVVAKAVGT